MKKINHRLYMYAKRKLHSSMLFDQSWPSHTHYLWWRRVDLFTFHFDSTSHAIPSYATLIFTMCVLVNLILLLLALADSYMCIQFYIVVTMVEFAGFVFLCLCLVVLLFLHIDSIQQMMNVLRRALCLVYVLLSPSLLFCFINIY